MDFSDKCRTCLESKDHKSFTCIVNNCYLEKTFKDVIMMLVPETKETLNDAECVCENCADTLQRSAALIQRCLVIDTTLKTCKNVPNRDSTQIDLPNKIQPTEEIPINLVNGNDTQVDITNEIICIPNVILLTDPTNTPVAPKIIENCSPEVTIAQTHLQNDVIHEECLNNDHDYCVTDNSDDPAVMSLLNNIGDHNRIVSLHAKDLDTMAKYVTSLTKNRINLSDISKKSIAKRKRILLISSTVPTKCPICSKSLKYERHHVCKKRVGNRDQIRSKVLEKCPKCNRDINVAFMSHHLNKHERDVRKHLERERIKEAKRQASLTCETCKERFSSKEELECHLEIHPPWVCEQCGKGFVKKESLHAHKGTHNAPNSYICEICGKGFKDMAMLRVHLQIHDDKKYQCPSCPKVFNQKCKVSRHVKLVHEKARNCQCTQCGKLFAGAATHDAHVRLVHSKEKPFECNICQTRFGRADYLQNHILRHTGERRERLVNNIPHPERRKRKLRYTIQDNGQPAPCKFCGKWFKNMEKLRRHLETHVKRYPCKFCPLTFSRKAFCKRHEKIHEGGTVSFFRCNVCWKRLSTKEALDEHVTIHNNPRYACDLCGKPFNRIFLMNHHKLMEHHNIPNDDQAEEIIYDSLLEVSGDTNAIQLLN